MTSTTSSRRAVGIVRQSKDNDGESPRQQAARIKDACERDGLKLVALIEELDVSGGTPLEKRDGLRSAVEMVEARQAEVIVGAYFDRLVRSLRVQDELVSRVEAADGQVLALDTGRITNGSAGQWLSGTLIGAVAEYHRRTTAERASEGQAAAIARGVLPYPNVPPGYVRGGDGILQPDPTTRNVVVQAFDMRAEGATVAEVRTLLRKHGIERSYHGVLSMLNSRIYLGEIHFGELSNLDAHPPIIDPETWQRVQRRVVTRGRKPKSDRLLARLGVLRCGSCGSRMVVGSANHGAYPIYRCPPTGDCQRRVTISAKRAESAVVEAVQAALADVQGRASAAHAARQVESDADRAQTALDAALRVLDGFEDETAARERLAELREARDAARERVEQLGGVRSAVTVSAATDWGCLSLTERRALIRGTVERATIAPGRGSDRISVDLFGE